MAQRAKLAVALVPAARFCIMKSFSGEIFFVMSVNAVVFEHSEINFA
jgi:hypothetical protein